MTFIQELYAGMHAHNLRLYVNVASSIPDNELKLIAASSDGIVLMNYDEHEANSDPGPVASQNWFIANLQRVLRIVPKEKIICAVGSYGYDWTLTIPNPKDRKHPKPQVLDTQDLSVSEAWQEASDADADLDLNYDASSTLTSSTLTKTTTSATWSGFSMLFRFSMRCALRGNSAYRPLRSGGLARKTAPCGASGTSPALLNRCRRSAPCSPATMWTPRVKETFSA